MRIWRVANACAATFAGGKFSEHMRLSIAILASSCIITTDGAVISLDVEGMETGQPMWEKTRFEGRLPNDFYYHGDNQVPLERSVRECAVSFVSGGREEHEKRIGDLYPGATLAGEMRNAGRIFYIVRIVPPNRAAIEQLLARLRAARDVQFAGPVFYHSESGARLVPTDAIVVKAKAGITKQELVDLASLYGLMVHDMMPGAKNEYVLHLADPKSGDAIEKARALQESGRFEWVEPNFIRELQKQAL